MFLPADVTEVRDAQGSLTDHPGAPRDPVHVGPHRGRRRARRRHSREASEYCAGNSSGRSCPVDAPSRLRNAIRVESDHRGELNLTGASARARNSHLEASVGFQLHAVHSSVTNAHLSAALPTPFVFFVL